MRVYLNEGWLYEEELGSNIKEEVRIPHTVKEIPFNYFSQNLYEKLCSYTLNLFADKSWEDKALVLTFEAVGHLATLYVNKKEILTHKSGYTAFSVDISEYLEFGCENEIYLKVDSHENLNIPPFGHLIDYMTYGGIYRDVYLDIKNKTHINDVFVFTTNVLEDEKTLNISAELNNETDAFIEYILAEKNKEEIKKFSKEKIVKELKSELKVCDVKLWDTKSPNLYTLTANLYIGETLIDTKVTTFGFREVSFTKDAFYLNGEKLKLRGVNRHQAWPYIGYAMPKSGQVLDAKILKEELGLNAVRTSHYPQSHYFLDACDELGLLVFTEIPGWQYMGDKEWQEQVLVNVEEMVKQYRNHPSIFIWGTRINESPDNLELYTKTNLLAKSLDSSRAIGGVRNIRHGDFMQDVYTYNDFSHVGRNRGTFNKEEVTPDVNRAYMITEYNGHMFPTKAYDNEEIRLEHALRHARVMNGYYSKEDITGGFAWCMYDYNTHKEFGSGDNICHHGVMDMFRNKKLAAQVYAIQGEKSVLQTSSTMNIGEHPGGYLGDIYLFSNADYVNFYKNDKLLKVYKQEDTAFKSMPKGPILLDDLVGDTLIEKEGFSKEKSDEIKRVMHLISKHGHEDMPKELEDLISDLSKKYDMKLDDFIGLYISHIGNWGGELGCYRFDAYKDGKLVNTLTKEPIFSKKLVLNIDKADLIEENSYDIATVRIKYCDQNENVLEYFNEPVILKVSGDIKLVGPEIISLKGGMGGTYIKSDKKNGTGTLTVSTVYNDTAVANFTVKI